MREKFDRLAAVTDLVLLDIKHIDPQEHLKLCGQPQDNILAFARYLEQKQIPVWVRHVVVPGITDREDYLHRLGLYLGTLKNIKALDVLPYHDMGKTKYQSLGIPYPLEDTQSPSARRSGQRPADHSQGHEGEPELLIILNIAPCIFLLNIYRI